jgi:hypothetical protein
VGSYNNTVMKKTILVTLVLSMSGVMRAQHFEPKYMFMNGFDFGLQSVDKLKYVGHFNIYVPVSDSRKLGFNTGLLKLNNLTNDTVVNYNADNVLQGPLDNLQVGSTYTKQFNKYTTKTSLSTYSAYFQVLKRIKASPNYAISCHLHTELLLSKIRTVRTIDSITSTQVNIVSEEQIPNETIQLIEKIQDRNYTSAGGYFGAGLTYDYNFKDSIGNDIFSLFMQGTVGYSLEHPSRNSPNNDLGYDGYNKEWFYLVRGYFQYKLSATGKSELLVGVDFRGLLGGQVPLNSIYAGLNIDLENIAKLFQ